MASARKFIHLDHWEQRAPEQSWLQKERPEDPRESRGSAARDSLLRTLARLGPVFEHQPYTPAAPGSSVLDAQLPL